MNVVASSPEGLEKSLAEEISNLGGFNINTYKRFINFECDFEHLNYCCYYYYCGYADYFDWSCLNCG